MSTAIATRMSADEFLRRYGDETGLELVRGEIRSVPMPGSQHGEVCFRAALLVGTHVVSRNLGRLMTNDTFVRVGTDNCRGADICFVSYATLPPDRPTPKGPILPPLELVVEVKSPSDTTAELTDKANEYLQAGVTVVLVLDPGTESAAVHRLNELPQRFHNGDVLTLPDILPDFATPVAAFFE